MEAEKKQKKVSHARSFLSITPSSQLSALIFQEYSMKSVICLPIDVRVNIEQITYSRLI